MSVVSFSEFQEHRNRRRKRLSMLGDLVSHEDLSEHHADGPGKDHIDEAPCREGAHGSEELEHDENQGGR